MIIDLQFFGQTEKEKVSEALKNNELPRKRFNKNIKLFNGLFENGVETPIEKVYNERDRFYHIVNGHPGTAYEKNFVNKLKDVLKNPDEIRATKDRHGKSANSYIKEIDGRPLMVVVRKGNIITAYEPKEKYMENNIKKKRRIL